MKARHAVYGTLLVFGGLVLGVGSIVTLKVTQPPITNTLTVVTPEPATDTPAVATATAVPTATDVPTATAVPDLSGKYLYHFPYLATSFYQSDAVVSGRGTFYEYTLGGQADNSMAHVGGFDNGGYIVVTDQGSVSNAKTISAYIYNQMKQGGLYKLAGDDGGSGRVGDYPVGRLGEPNIWALMDNTGDQCTEVVGTTYGHNQVFEIWGTGPTNYNGYCVEGSWLSDALRQVTHQRM